MSEWDLVVVGAGPAGTATALGALHAAPTMRVLLLDRDDFPRDKTCGDGIAPHVFDALAEVGVHDLAEGWAPVHRLDLAHRTHTVNGRLRRPVWVIPRAEFDARLVRAAIEAGAVLLRQRVRQVRVGDDGVTLDNDLHAPLLVGADGAYSAVRAALGRPASITRGEALSRAAVQVWCRWVPSSLRTAWSYAAPARLGSPSRRAAAAARPAAMPVATA